MQIHPNITSASTIELSEADRAAVWEAVGELARFDPASDPETFAAEAQLRSAALSEPLRRGLQRFRRRGNSFGGLLVRGLPIGPIPDTPASADEAVGIKLPAAATLAVFAGAMGDQYGFRPELGGNVVQDVLPVAGLEQTQTSVSSDVRLKDHVEMAFSEYRSDYVGLLCIRADHEHLAGTTLSCVDQIMPLLESQTIATLGQERFKTTVDESFLRGVGAAEQIWIGPIQILGGRAERPTLRADFAETVGLDPEAERALERLQAVARKVTSTIMLDVGDLLLIDNHRAFHGRTSFNARGDGRDRWLLRTFITKDLRRSEAVRPGDGRIVDSDFAVGPNVFSGELRIRRATRAESA
jgi:L-asparagine oxygenase